MKKIILSFGMLLFVGMSAFGQQLALHQPSAKEEVKESTSFFMWEKATHDFGTIEKGVPVTAVFEFTNKGSSPVSIRKVNSSCGCTVTDYTQTSLAPGERGYIKATYNAAREGAFHKKVVVFSSREGEQQDLILKGIVK